MEDTFAAMTGVLKDKQSANGCKAAATMFTLIYANSEWGRRRRRLLLLQRRRQRAGWMVHGRVWDGNESDDSLLISPPPPLVRPASPCCSAVFSLTQQLYDSGYEIADHTVRHLGVSQRPASRSRLPRSLAAPGCAP